MARAILLIGAVIVAICVFGNIFDQMNCTKWETRRVFVKIWIDERVCVAYR